MSEPVDGFYAGYFTGNAGSGVGLFVFFNGIIAGVDALGVQFDGEYRSLQNGRYVVTVEVAAPAGAQLVQGVSTGAQSLTYKIETTVPADLENAELLTMPTPYGPVNVKFKKIKGMPR